jgi:hypothetical protein
MEKKSNVTVAYCLIGGIYFATVHIAVYVYVEEEKVECET